MVAVLTSRDEKYAARLRELAEEGRRLATRETGKPGLSAIRDDDAIALHAWLAKVQNVMNSLFGTGSSQTKHLEQLIPESGIASLMHAYQVRDITGLLLGALDDLEHGFLTDRQMLLAGEVFDSVLQQAKHLLANSYKDVAAVLGRVVLENALRRIASAESVDADQKASKINDDLKAGGRYPQPQWRQIQGWLDIGNAAAHGNFDDYSSDQVKVMLDGVELFLATQLHA